MVATVDLQPHVHALAIHAPDLLETIFRLLAVDNEAEGRLLIELGGFHCVDRRKGESPGDVAESRGGELLRLIESRDGNSTGTHLHLVVGDFNTLVRFDVWTEGNAKAVCTILHPG